MTRQIQTVLPALEAKRRLPLVDGLRALAATVIAWHHFALYPPLAEWAMTAHAGLIEGLRDYARATQVFFVVGGYVLAHSMTPRRWDLKQVCRFVAQRYCRLGLPYLAAVALAVCACWLGQGSLPVELVGLPPTIPQLLAHAVFLQDILGYESVSAGLWFVCINFQLSLIYAGMLWLRDALPAGRGRPTPSCSVAVPMFAGWTLAAASLFYFNLDERFDVWGVYYFCYFFLGVMLHHGLRGGRSQIALGAYAVLLIGALVYQWRWRLASAVVAGALLFCGSKVALLPRWSAGHWLRYLGRTAYSLFLVHFPVLVVIAALWVRLDWTSPISGLTGIWAAYLVSLLVADLFYRMVEGPAARLSRRFA